LEVYERAQENVSKTVQNGFDAKIVVVTAPESRFWIRLRWPEIPEALAGRMPAVPGGGGLTDHGLAAKI